MSFRKVRSPESIREAIGRRLTPVFAGSMLLVLSVAVAFGWLALRQQVGAERTAVVLAAGLQVIFWAGLAETAALLAGIAVFRLVARRIARPLSELSRSVVRFSRDGGAVVFLTDGPIVEINSLAETFNELFALRERQARELQELTRNVLHDLRTPLTHIRHCAELVHGGHADPVPSMETVAESCAAILNLVETNAEISANYSGIGSDSPEMLDVSRILSDLVDLYAAVAESKRISLSLSLPNEPMRFHGHRDRIQRLVINLLDNAFKFTPEGGRVTVSAEGRADGLRLRVEDSGVGIGKDDLPHVFERFYRSGNCLQVAGNGLGLSLVHAIVTFYGGTIGCQSSEGRGTIFTVVLPLLHNVQQSIEC